MITAVTGQANLPDRRRVLAAALGMTGALAVGGCGVRLEGDAPQVPGIRRQGPPADAQCFVTVHDEVRRLVAQAQSLVDAGEAAPWAAPLSALHRGQLGRLESVMAGQGMVIRGAAPTSIPAPGSVSTTVAPRSTATASAGVSGSAPPSTSTGPSTPSAGALELARAEATPKGAATTGQAWAATKPNRPLLLSIVLSRFAAAEVLGHGSRLPRGTAMKGAPAVALLGAIRPAVYGLEVAAARTRAEERALFEETLAWLSAARSELEEALGTAAPPAPLNYRLPVEVLGGKSGGRAARALVGSVLTACAAQLDAVQPLGAPAQQWLQRIWARSTCATWRFGAPMHPLPGLSR